MCIRDRGIDGLNAVDALAHLLSPPGIRVLRCFSVGFRDACVNLVGTQSRFCHCGSLDFNAIFIGIAPLA